MEMQYKNVIVSAINKLNEVLLSNSAVGCNLTEILACIIILKCILYLNCAVTVFI